MRANHAKERRLSLPPGSECPVFVSRARPIRYGAAALTPVWAALARAYWRSVIVGVLVAACLPGSGFLSPISDLKRSPMELPWFG
jgi:hypothetical protein